MIQSTSIVPLPHERFKKLAIIVMGIIIIVLVVLKLTGAI